MPKRYDKTNPPMMSAEILLGSLDAGEELGADITPVLEANRIDRKLVETGEGLLPVHTVVHFLNDCADRFSCEHFGLLVGKHQPAVRFAMFGQLVRFCDTLQHAVEDAIRFSLLNSEYTDWSLERQGDLAMLVRNTRFSYDAPMMQMHTLAVMVVYKAMRAVCACDVPLRQVLFSHRAPEQAQVLERHFGAPIVFNHSFNALVFAESALRTPIPTRDPDVHRMLTSHLTQLAARAGMDEDLGSRLRHTIKMPIGSRHCNLEGVCRTLGMHPRALQRVLRDLGITFKSLLTEVRQELAEEYIRNSEISVIELSEMLGYSNASAFSRAFKHNTGMSPQLWKSRNRG
jgi:AraC-like DNA-binding protein